MADFRQEAVCDSVGKAPLGHDRACSIVNGSLHAHWDGSCSGSQLYHSASASRNGLLIRTFSLANIGLTSGAVIFSEEPYWNVQDLVGLVIPNLSRRQGKEKMLRSMSDTALQSVIAGISLYQMVCSMGVINSEVLGIVLST